MSIVKLAWLLTFLIMLMGEEVVQAKVTYACSFENDCREGFKLNRMTFSMATRYISDQHSPAGYYAVADKTKPKTYSIESPQFQFEGTGCLEIKYYHTTHQGWRKCNNGHVTFTLQCQGAADRIIFEDKYSRMESRNKWNIITTTESNKNCKVKMAVANPLLESKEKPCDSPMFALDEIKVYDFECPTTEKTVAFLECSFTWNNCYWTESGDEWIHVRDYQSTNTRGTGPDSRYRLEYNPILGQNNKVGSYISLDAAKTSPNKKAYLESPLVISKDEACMKMFVDMNGKDVGKFIISYIINGETDVIFEKAGEQGERWFNVQVDLPVDTSFKAKLEVITESGYLGDVAIDNIMVVEGKCSKKTISKCDLSKELGEAETCDLDDLSRKKKCGYDIVRQNVNGEDVSTISFNDVDCPERKFLLVKVPPNTYTPRKSCLSFDYKFEMTGCNIAIWQRYTDPNGRERKERRYYLRNRLSNQWENYQTTIYIMTYGFQHTLALEFHNHKWHCSNVHLANIKITDGKCDIGWLKETPISELGNMKE